MKYRSLTHGLVLVLLVGFVMYGCGGGGSSDTDAAATVLGLFAGAALAHNFLLASSPAGTGAWGPVAVVIGLVFCLVVGFLMTEKAK